MWLTSFALAQTSSKASGQGVAVKAASATPISKDPIGDADRLFSRGDAPNQDQQALVILESALATNGKNYDLLWRAARAAYYIGDFGPKEEKLKHYEKGIALSQRAIKAQPNSVEGHFWLAASYGGKAQTVSDKSQLLGDLKALSMIKKIRAGMQTVVKLNDAYENGNAYLALGEIDRELPGVMGGNKKRAITQYEQGLKVAPENLDLKVALSKAYKDAGRKDDARRLLEEVIKATPTTRIQREAQDEAKQLLSK
ncbi:MAG: tetratricopeptide repeat protein [Blastocatellia bacterium]|nr:tetratricopeptide repeat protein [Blastocatellia bacterium]